MLCAIEVPDDQLSAYGIFDVETVPDASNPDVLRVRGMVEKPNPPTPPVEFRGRRSLHLGPQDLRCAAAHHPGAGGELQLTDAIALLIADGEPVHVVVHRGTRHDLGNPGGYLKAAVDFALDRDDYGPDLRDWLVARLELEQ